MQPWPTLPWCHTPAALSFRFFVETSTPGICLQTSLGNASPKLDSLEARNTMNVFLSHSPAPRESRMQLEMISVPIYRRKMTFCPHRGLLFLSQKQKPKFSAPIELPCSFEQEMIFLPVWTTKMNFRAYMRTRGGFSIGVSIRDYSATGIQGSLII